MPNEYAICTIDFEINDPLQREVKRDKMILESENHVSNYTTSMEFGAPTNNYIYMYYYV